MKKMIFTLAAILAIGALSPAAAQMKVNKLGYVNSLELLDAMPEKGPIDEQIEKYATELEASLEKMYVEYQKKVAVLQEGVQNKTIGEVDQEMKAKELGDMEKRITDFQESANEKVSRKRSTLYQPIIEKINAAIKAAAKENGYTYIFDSSAGSILYADEADNLLDLLKKKLGIPVTPAAATTPK